MPGPFGPYGFRPNGTGGGEGGGSTGINYLEAYYDGDDVTGITSSNAGLTYTVNTASSPIGEGTNIRLSKDASNRQNEYWTIPMTAVQLGDREGNKSLYFSVLVRTSANYATNDIRWRIYDTDAAAYVNLSSLQSTSGYQIASPDATLFVGSFSTTEADDNYELRAFIDSTNATAYDLDVVRFTISPQTTQPGAIVNPITAYTPTLINTTNVSENAATWYRVGEYIFIEGYARWNGGGSGAGTWTVGLPSGLTIDTAKLASTGSLEQTLGNAVWFDNGTAYVPTNIIYTSTTAVAFTTINVAGTTLVGTSFANGDTIVYKFSVPISNWSASAALSTTEAMLSTVTVKVTGNPASASAGNVIIWPTESWDDTGSYNTTTGRFTAPKAGKYRVHGVIASANAGVGVAVYIDAVSNSYAGQTDAGGEVTFDATVQVNAGQLIDLRPDNTLDATSGFMYIEEIPNFSIFSVYGTFELLTATSSTKTPGATANFHQLTGNSLTLTPGTWKVTYSAQFDNSGVSPTYASVGSGLYAANGADSGTVPALLSTLSGLTVRSVQPASAGLQTLFATTSFSALFQEASAIITTTQTHTIYAVTYATMSTASNARVTVYANAERLQ